MKVGCPGGTPEAHHFLPAAHLARFSLDASSVQVRDRTVSVYSKRSGQFRRAKAGKLAFENDLYTFRLPVLTDVQPDPDQLIRAVLDPANKDGEIESMKAEIEEAGIAAMREIDGWQPGPRILSEDERQPMLSYAGLLLAQHPTMMAARSDALSRSFWNLVQDQVIRNPMLDVLTDEMHRGTSAMALIFDGLATALELDYLAWKIVRWPAGPAVILGDTGVAAGFSPKVLGVGDAWSARRQIHASDQPNDRRRVWRTPRGCGVRGGARPGSVGDRRPERHRVGPV